MDRWDVTWYVLRHSSVTVTIFRSFSDQCGRSSGEKFRDLKVVNLVLALLLIPYQFERCLHELIGSVVGHIYIAPGFKLRPSYVRRVFHLSLRLITSGSCSAQLLYHLPKLDLYYLIKYNSFV